MEFDIIYTQLEMHGTMGSNYYQMIK